MPRIENRRLRKFTVVLVGIEQYPDGEGVFFSGITYLSAPDPRSAGRLAQNEYKADHHNSDSSTEIEEIMVAAVFDGHIKSVPEDCYDQSMHVCPRPDGTINCVG